MPIRRRLRLSGCAECGAVGSVIPWESEVIFVTQHNRGSYRHCQLQAEVREAKRRGNGQKGENVLYSVQSPAAKSNFRCHLCPPRLPAPHGCLPPQQTSPGTLVPTAHTPPVVENPGKRRLRHSWGKWAGGDPGIYTQGNSVDRHNFKGI